MVLEGERGVLTSQLIDGLNSGQVVVSDVGATIPGVTAATLQRFLIDLVRAVAAGSLKPDKVAVAVRSAGVEDTSDALGSDLADALWYGWLEVEGDAGGDAKSRVADAAKDLLKEALVTKPQLFESGEGEFFEWCGMVVSKEVWRRKEIRSHTKHVYVQRKRGVGGQLPGSFLAGGAGVLAAGGGVEFNLLREESEGYAKLATLLNQQAAGCLSPAGTAAA
ncbi:hypothetical protein CHLNCDRAFT_145626, partial [Chlorella variabilis]